MTTINHINAGSMQGSPNRACIGMPRRGPEGAPVGAKPGTNKISGVSPAAGHAAADTVGVPRRRHIGGIGNYHGRRTAGFFKRSGRN